MLLKASPRMADKVFLETVTWRRLVKEVASFNLLISDSEMNNIVVDATLKEYI